MKHVLLWLLIACPILAMAQNRKDANQAVVRLTTFDAQGRQLQQSHAFFYTQEGRIVAPYSPFKGASRAEIEDAKGRKAAVSRIVGASSSYDVVVAQLDAALPKAVVLRRAQQSPIRGTMGLGQAFFAENKKQQPEQTAIATVEKADAYDYFTLTTPNEAKYFGTPAINERGEVFALVQPNLLKGAITACAIDIRVADSLRVSSTSAFNTDLTAIAIPKLIPVDNPTDAYTYIYMVSRSNTDSLLVATALADFMQAYPTNSVVYGDAASFYATRGDYARADHYLAQGIARADANQAALYDMKSALYYALATSQGAAAYPAWSLDEALAAAERAYALSPMPSYLLQQGQVAFAQQRYADAYERFQQVNASPIASVQTFLFAATTLERMEGDQKAARLALLDSAVNRCAQPYGAEAAIPLFKRGQLLGEMGEYRKAVADLVDYERILGRNNLTAYFYYLRSQLEVRAKMFQQALDDFETAISLSASQAEWEGYMVEKALLLVQVSHLDEAIATARDVVARNPNNADANKVLGLAYGEKKNRKLAQQYLRRAAELGDENATQLLNRYAKAK